MCDPNAEYKGIDVWPLVFILLYDMYTGRDYHLPERGSGLCGLGRG